MPPALMAPSPDAGSIRWLPLLLIPAILIALSLPLVFRLVPRNRWYGYRTPRSLGSDAEWYRMNRIAGVAVIAAAFASAAVKGFLLFVLELPYHSSLNHVDALAVLLALAATAAATRGSDPSRPL